MIWQLHLSGFLVAVRLLSDLLSSQDCIGLIAEMCGVRHGSGERVRTDENKEVSFAVDIREIANGMNYVLEAFEVVAATVQTQVDDEFVRMLLLDQVEKPLRLLAQTFIPAKAAGDGVGVRQIGVSEVVVRFLAKQGALFECGNPAYL